VSTPGMVLRAAPSGFIEPCLPSRAGRGGALGLKVGGRWQSESVLI